MNHAISEVKNQERQYTEEEFRLTQKHSPKLRNNTPPVCTNKRSYELIIRRQAVDTGKMFYECEICGRITGDYSNLNKHCRIHTGEKPYKCDVCGKAFSDRSCYDVHYRIHTGIKPYDCDLCGKAFRSSPGLTSHVCGHTRYKKESYTCYVCEKTFCSSWGLEFHEQGHDEGEMDRRLFDFQ